MDEPVERQAAPPRTRLARRLALFVLVLASFAVGGIYTATSVVFHVDTIVLPSVDLSVPKPVARVLPGLVATPAEGSPGTTRINILVLGLDRRPHHDQQVDGPPNADSIHIISLDPVTKTGADLALPRDLYIEVPSPAKKGEFWETRVNQVYKLGEDHQYPGGGAAFAKRAIEYVFQIPIDYYVVVDWVAFADVVEALGGVWVTVPEEIKNVEGFNPHDGNAFKITIPAGTHYMDAITALAYARFRGDEQNDFGRISRQQEVMRSAADEALRRGWLTQAPKLYERFRSAISTDLSTVKLPGLVLLAKSIGLDQVKTVSLAGEHREAVKPVLTPWGEDVLVPVWEAMGQLIRDAVDDRAVRAEGATVTVINATGIRGQDERAAAYLRRFRLAPDRIVIGAPTVSGAANAAAGVRAQNTTLRPAVATTISYTGDASKTAARVAEWLNVPASQVAHAEEEAGAPAAVTVSLGTDVRLPDDERFNRYRPR